MSKSRFVAATDLSTRFVDDPGLPDGLFVRGKANIDSYPTVGIVGSRYATPYGKKIARHLGRELSESGVIVVSGLARGIDGCAHEGVIAAQSDVEVAPPVAVVGGGLDVPYPKSNRELWEKVHECGVLISEYPDGTESTKMNFPKRNRIIAALSDVLVVIESTSKSGTNYTVREANKRGRSIMALPGPITSPQSEGTNKLLRDGCAPVLDVEDVLLAVSLERPDLPIARYARNSKGNADIDSLGDELASVFTAVDVTMSSLSTIATRAGINFAQTAICLEELCKRGYVQADGDGWIRA
jgi:DNA processing protein